MVPITENDLALFRERAKTELKSTGDIGRLAWDDVVEALCKEVARLRSGDCAKLREALKAIVGLCAGLMPTWDGAVGRIKDIAETALAAPATSEKSSAVGNAAKLREALEALLNLAYEVEDMNSDSGPRTSMPTKFVIDTAKSALSAPPRNCDRFADETDAQIAFLNEVWLISVTKETALERDKFENWTDEMRSRYAKWLLATATEQKGQENG